MKSIFLVGSLGALVGVVVALVVNKFVAVRQGANIKSFLVAAGAVVGLAVALLINKSESGGDTPIIIAGGSIYGDAYYQGWVQDSPYYASVGSQAQLDNILLQKFTLADGVTPAPDSITGTGGWVITFSDKDSQGNSKPNAISFCSKKNCNPQSGLDQDGNVYLSAGPKGRWREKNSGKVLYELRFHDTDCDGSSGDTESSCDIISQITITTKNQPQATYLCPTGTCRVIVGMTP
jgi:hypothetical protein